MRPLLTSIFSLFLQLEALSATSSNTPSSSLIATNLNASSSAICTPSECIQGANTLSAGTTIISPSFINGSSRSIILLPGTYTGTSSSLASNTSTIPTFDSTSSFTTPAGFSSSGSLGSAFTVTLLPGVVTYTSSLYQGIASHIPISNPSLLSNNSVNSNSNRNPIQSFLISDDVWVIMNVGAMPGVRTVIWKGVNDVGNLVEVSGGISILDIQSSKCPIPCASGGVCTTNTCVCKTGFTGNTCNACSPSFFGPSCLPCVIGCASCDAGITGTGRCLPVPTVNVTAAACNCINGVCNSTLPTATCSCNAGWGVAGNGTQCGACASGYYPSSTGDCLACDASCASCSGSTGTCLTCQLSLQPLSTDPNKCTIADSALLNGTFIRCPPRTFFQRSTSSCVTCNPLCDTCWNETPSGCLSCRTPNALLAGGCVGLNPNNGVCDSLGILVSGLVVGSNAGWFLDNAKGECDALPAKCISGAIDNFNTVSTRSQLTCSACLAGTFLFSGKCLSSCPTGTTSSTDGKSCVACDPTCLSCSGSPIFCTACANPSKLTLNGICITGPSCPTGYFTLAGNTTCIACHPDCATCGPTFDKCLSCPSTRPILSPSTSTCLQTCSSSQYFDSSKNSCSSCSSNCETCSGAGDSACLSCSNSNMVLKQGSCVAARCTSVVSSFGVCLSSLVVVNATSVNSPSSSKVLPWWTILLIVLGSLIVVVILGLMYRRKEQKRRRLQTARFADELGRKEVALKLQALPSRIAYPVLPDTRNEEDFEEELRNSNIPLTPPFVGRMEEERDRNSIRWSASSYGSSKRSYPKPLIPQQTGASLYSQNSVASTTLPWGTHNPHKR